LVGRVVHGVEPLKPRLAIDELQTRVRKALEAADDEVDVAFIAINRSVQRPRPELRVGRELECGLRKCNQFRKTKKMLFHLLTGPMMKKRLSRFENWSGVMLNRPVVLSSVA